MSFNREAGVELALKYDATRTAAIIKTRCFDRIFASAIEEVGEERLATALREAKDPEWAYYALREVSGLSAETRKALKQVAGV